MMIWAPLFVFLLKFQQLGGTNQYHLAYRMLLCYIHYIAIGYLYYKQAYGRVFKVCKQKQRLVWQFQITLIFHNVRMGLCRGIKLIH